MVDLVESFGNVQQEKVCLFSLADLDLHVHARSPMNETNCLTGASLPETML